MTQLLCGNNTCYPYRLQIALLFDNIKQLNLLFIAEDIFKTLVLGDENLFQNFIKVKVGEKSFI